MKKKKLLLFIPIGVLLVLIAAFFIYIGIYYHSTPEAKAYLNSNEKVVVKEESYGYFFDGPSEREELIFYPGAKVESSAYAPMLNKLASEGVDVFLVNMPFNLAIFGKNKANGIIQKYTYTNWYMGGHSLGGVMASAYAAAHEDIKGVILFASYPNSKLRDNQFAIMVYGSNDNVLKKNKMESSKSYITGPLYELEIAGGNHAQFGNYGNQKHDGTPTITWQEQQKQTVDFIIKNKKIKAHRWNDMPYFYIKTGTGLSGEKVLLVFIFISKLFSLNSTVLLSPNTASITLLAPFNALFINR